MWSYMALFKNAAECLIYSAQSKSITVKAELVDITKCIVELSQLVSPLMSF